MEEFLLETVDAEQSFMRIIKFRKPQRMWLLRYETTYPYQQDSNLYCISVAKDSKCGMETTRNSQRRNTPNLILIHPSPPI